MFTRRELDDIEAGLAVAARGPDLPVRRRAQRLERLRRQLAGIVVAAAAAVIVAVAMVIGCAPADVEPGALVLAAIIGGYQRDDIVVGSLIARPAQFEDLRAGPADIDQPLAGEIGVASVAQHAVVVPGAPVAAQLGRRVVVQYHDDNLIDAHYIHRQPPAVQYQYGCFLATYLRDGVPTVFAPAPVDDPCP